MRWERIVIAAALATAAAWGCSGGGTNGTTADGGASGDAGADALADACALGCVDGHVASGPAGSVDPSFAAGKPMLPIEGAMLPRLAKLPNGNLMVFVDSGSTNRFAFVQLRPDGTLATPTVGFDTLNAGPSDAIVTTDGHVVVASSKASGGCVVQRYSLGAQLDATYASGGTATVGDASCSAPRLVAQSGGKTLIVGQKTGTGASVVMYRLNADGSADASFGAAGTAAIPSFAVQALVASSKSDGSFYLAGYPTGGTTGAGSESIVHVGADGTQDMAFGASGTASVAIPGTAGSGSIGAALGAADDDTLVLAVGRSTAGVQGASVSVAVLSATGAPAGVVASFPMTGVPSAAAIRSDGTAIVGGGIGQAQSGDVLVELSPARSPNPAFSAGFAADGGLAPILAANFSFAILSFEADGKILAAGDANSRAFFARLFP